jgi:hypothetical protein
VDSSKADIDEVLPYLQVTSPTGSSFQLMIPDASPFPIGRSSLGSDPHVSRVHCTVMYKNSELLVTDNNSKNGTLIFHHKEWSWLYNAEVRLQDGDVIRIPGGQAGSMKSPTQPSFWDLVFHDPLATRPVDFGGALWRLEFDAERDRFIRVKGGHREDLGLTPGSQEYRFLRYMHQRLALSQESSVDCSHEELIGAIWEGTDRHGRTPNDIAHLIRNLRLRMEPNPTRPRFLITLRGGYRLVERPLPDLGDIER